MAANNAFGAPIPLSDIESVLAWVDSFKLSRATKKINRDFSDAVLLAEILAFHYPKLVEMHNYPPRNSHSLKLNNWMTLNRKVLKKLKLNLCCNTMEQLANCTPGVVERVLVMVREKIKRDEELEKSCKETEANMSSGGSYYEACGDEDHVLVVPVKTRVNGVLETIQQKVVSYDAHAALKAELKDAQDATDLLRQKVEHLDNLIKLKDERITELQKQLERRQARRKEPEITNSLSIPFDDFPTPALDTVSNIITNKSSGIIKIDSKTKIEGLVDAELPTTKVTQMVNPPTILSKHSASQKGSKTSLKGSETSLKGSKSNTHIPSMVVEPSITEVTSKEKIVINKVNNSGDLATDVERIKSDVFKEANDKNAEGDEEFKDSLPTLPIVTIEDTIKTEILDISQSK